VWGLILWVADLNGRKNRRRWQLARSVKRGLSIYMYVAWYDKFVRSCIARTYVCSTYTVVIIWQITILECSAKHVLCGYFLKQFVSAHESNECCCVWFVVI
jgi:hypothetical protein